MGQAAVVGNPWERRSLDPVANLDQTAPVQPTRYRPYRVEATDDGHKVYVTLAGKEIRPGREVAVLDVSQPKTLKRIEVGSGPRGLALHPSGRWMVVTNRYSNFLSVIDVYEDRVVSEIPAIFYCEDLVFTPNGRTAYVSNFWKNQVLVIDLEVQEDRLQGRMRHLGFDREAFVGSYRFETQSFYRCTSCRWQGKDAAQCERCGQTELQSFTRDTRTIKTAGLHGVLRAGCGTSDCHLYRSGGFYAGPDKEEAFRSAVVHAFFGDPDGSPLIRATTSVRHGGWADAVDGRHHPGGIVFDDPEHDPDYQRLWRWIATGSDGPGISVGVNPRDLEISPDGKTLYVANTGSLDISVVNLDALRETRRIFTRSPVNDVEWVDGRLVLATLGVGSGHPKAHHAGRESLDRNHPDAEFTLFRDTKSGMPLPLSEQDPLGPYDDVDGTAQEKFRDITNDVVILDPAADSVAAYVATQAFTRYTSDSFEALPGDKKGDVPAALMKVIGAFPEQIVRRGDRLYITMSGTFQIQEWQVNSAAEPERRLTPGRVFDTGLKPVGIALAGDTLVVANHLGESVSFIDTTDGSTSEVSLGAHPEPFPATDFERGEFFVQTSVFSVDQDQSCIHCHYRDTSDGKRWSVSQVMGQSRDGQERTGGSREVPDIRALVHKVPFFIEGILSIDEPLTMMMEHNPLVDFQGQTPAGDFDDIRVEPQEMGQYGKSADTIVVATGRKTESGEVRLVDQIKRREIHFRRVSAKYMGREHSFRDFQRFIGAYQGGEPRLLPNPVDADDAMVQHGRAVFNDPKVGCAGCHPAPTFTDKKHVHNQNRGFPPLVTAAARDMVHTLISADRIDYLNGYVRVWDTDDQGRIEEREGFYAAPSLHGIWARPPKFLHHGHAVSLREVLCTPDHIALRRHPFSRHDADRPGRREKGLNERDGIPDTHGVTSLLSVWDIECLSRFIQSIE